MKDLKNRFDVLADAADATTADLRDLDDALRTFSRELSDAIAEAQETFAELGRSAKGSEGPQSVSMEGDGGIGNLSASLESLAGMAASVGSQMRGALYEAMTPLLNIGNVLTQQINAVGGTFTTLARRIDAAMKFPAVDKFIADIGERAPEAWQKNVAAAVRTGHQIYSVWSAMGDVAGRGLGKVAGVRFNPVAASVQKLSISIRNVNAVTRQASASMANFGRSALAAFGFMGVAWSAVSFLKSGVKGASDLTETTNRLEVSLGEAAPAAKKFADEMVSTFGLAKNEIYGAEAAFGGLGKNLAGLSGDKLSAFSNKFTELSANLASYANFTSTADAAEALQTALAGNQSDRLKELGVVLLDDAVKARAVAEGFAKSTKEVSESAKVQARALMISEQLADANGDLAKTMNSPANMYRRFTGTLQNLAALVGQAVMPVLGRIGSVLISGLGQATALWEANKDTVMRFQESAFLAFESVKEGISGAAELLEGFPAVLDAGFGGGSWEMVKAFGANIVDNIGAAVDGIGSFLRNVPDYFHTALVWSAKWIDILGATLSSFGDWFGNNWVNLIRDSLHLAVLAFADFSTFMQRLSQSLVAFLVNPMEGFHFDATPFLNGFKAATEKLPGLAKPDVMALQKELDRTWDKIGKKDKEIRDKVKADVVTANEPAAANKSVAKGPAAEAAAADKKGKVETAGALELGSKEAYSAILKFKSGQQDQLLAEAKKQTVLLQELVDRKPSKRSERVNENMGVLNMA